MGAYSIADQIASWLADELAETSTITGEVFGYAVTMMPVPTPKGDAIIWAILVTLRSPYLGADHLGSGTKLQANNPPESAVRHAARQSAEALRAAFEQAKQDGLKAAANGTRQLPEGLKGLKL
jgi:hypothetical protein